MTTTNTVEERSAGERRIPGTKSDVDTSSGEADDDDLDDASSASFEHAIALTPSFFFCPQRVRLVTAHELVTD